MSFVIGENVGAYRIVAQLGQGGMATVFKAYHPGLDRYVAIKALHPAFKEDATFVQRFKREARIVAKLEHPHIVPIYDYAEHRGLAYLVLRFIEGETLKARLKRGPLWTAQIIQVVQQVGAALSYAHQQGILHRDIKPSNVLITGDPDETDSLGDLFLADFGLARIAEAGESTLSRDMMMGTPQYISPEQAKGERELDAGTDIYSLGVVLFELVTGRVPFSADTPYSIIHDHIFTPLPLPTSINPDLPQAVERVLLKALAKDRQDRYADVDSFVTAFAAGVNARHQGPAEVATILTPPPKPAPVPTRRPAQPVKPKAKKRIPTWILVGLGLLFLIFCLVALFTVRGLVRGIQAEATVTAKATVTIPASPSPQDPALEEKIARLEKTIEQRPDDARSRTELAFLYVEAGELNEAHQQMRQAVELRPEDEAIYLEIGHYLMARGDLPLAAEVFFAGLEVSPDSRPMRTNLALVLWRLGNPNQDPELAENLSRQITETASEEPVVHTLLAHALLSQGKMEEARVEIDHALRLAPRRAEGHLVNAIWLRKDGQLLAARRELRIALELGSDDEWLRLEIERMLESLDKDDGG